MYLKIKHDLYKIPMTLKEHSLPGVKRAVARSLNASRTWMNGPGARMISRRVRLPLKGTSKGGAGLVAPGVRSLLDMNKIRYSKKAPLASYALTVKSVTEPISLIHFLPQGMKRPIMQKGRPVKKRIPAQIMANVVGKSVKKKSAFVQRSNNAIQVFQRSETKGTLMKVKYRSLWNLIENDPIGEQLMKGAGERYTTAMEKWLPFYLSKPGAR